MRIKDIPKIERPREKLIRYGPEKLSNAELLAILLNKGRKGENVLELAKKFLRKYPKNNLVTLKFEEIKNFAGIGPTKACQLMASFELGKRLLRNKKATIVMSPKEIWQEMKDLRNNRKEYFVVFYLDVRNQIIKRELISVGTLNASLVHPRELFEPAIKNLAAQIIISHNHPSGDSHPSDEDIELTQRLIKAGEILGIEIIDHVIVTEKDYFSLKENKII